MQQLLNRRADLHGQRSLRPSFSASSLSPCTTRSPRLTCVSDGKPRRRLPVRTKGFCVRIVDGFVACHGAPFVAGSRRWCPHRTFTPFATRASSRRTMCGVRASCPTAKRPHRAPTNKTRSHPNARIARGPSFSSAHSPSTSRRARPAKAGARLPRKRAPLPRALASPPRRAHRSASACARSRSALLAKPGARPKGHDVRGVTCDARLHLRREIRPAPTRCSVSSHRSVRQPRAPHAPRCAW